VGYDVLLGLRELGVRVDDSPVTVLYTQTRPLPGVDSSESPLGRPAPAPAGEGGFEVLRRAAGEPVSYDPCRPIRYVIRSHGESPEMRDAITRAIQVVSLASGFQFVGEGFVDERPQDRRPPYDRAAYGARWSPVLIAFSDDAESPSLEGDTIGDGGSTPVPHGDPGVQRETYVSGQIRLDTPQLMAKGDAAEMTRAVMEHELGHVLGLDHVDDERQLMHPRSVATSTLGEGDLRGLATLGSVRCAPGV
jgi:hypothetical protein